MQERFMNQGRAYVIPAWVKSPEQSASPAPTGIISLIREGKNAGSLWADQALAELEIMTGRHFDFRRALQPSLFQHGGYEIEVRS